MTTPQRFTKGVTNVPSSNTMGQLIIPDPTSTHTFMYEFNRFNPGDWVITQVATGATTSAVTVGDVDGGVLAFYPNNGDDDSMFFQWKAYDHVETASEIFTLASGKKLWFKARFKVSDTGDSDFIIGLQSADTTPLTSPVDSIIWKSDDGDDLSDFQVYKASVASLNDTAISTLVDDTWLTVGFYWDGVDALEYFLNDAAQGKSEGITYPTAAMTPTFGVQNGSAAARTMSVDFICVIKER